METWAIVAAIAATAGGLGTLALATLAWRQLNTLQRQVAQGQVEVDAARRSADAADAAVQASIRARIDQSAPACRCPARAAGVAAVLG